MKSAEQRSILFALFITQFSLEVLSFTNDTSNIIQDIGNYDATHQLLPRNLPDAEYGPVMYAVGSNCRITGCCGRKIDSLRKECAVVIPFVAAMLSYMLGYGVSKYVSGSASTCSSTVTTSKTLVMVQFTTSTGTITDTTTFNRITFTTALSTVYTPSVVFTTSIITNVIVSTPTSYTLVPVTMPLPVDVTAVICNKGRKRSIKENDTEEDTMDFSSSKDPRSTVQPTVRQEASITHNLDPSFTFTQLLSAYPTLNSPVLSSFTHISDSFE